MKRPEFIKAGDTIGVTAPSFGATTEPYKSLFKSAIENLKKRGYKIKTGKTCFKNDGIGISTKPEICAKELTDFYLDGDVKAIISCGGGELMCQVMSYVDFDAIKKTKAKWFTGYSDNTNFLFPLVTKCNVMGIYGPCFPTFGKEWERTELDTIGIMEGKVSRVEGFQKFQSPLADSEKDPFSKYVLDQEKILKSFLPSNGKIKSLPATRKISFKGLLLGGCLDVVNNLSASSFDQSAKLVKAGKKIIWCLESCDLNTMDIRRSLWHMDSLGMFKSASAFLFGRPLAAYGQNMMGLDQYNAVTGLLSKYNVPIIMDCDFGHIDPAMPLVFGAESTVTVKGNDICVKFDL